MSDWKRDALNVLCERYGLILADHTFMDDRLEAGLSHVLRRAYAERAEISDSSSHCPACVIEHDAHKASEALTKAKAWEAKCDKTI